MDLLNRRRVEIEGRVEIEVSNGQIGSSVAGWVKVGIFVFSDNSILRILHFDRFFQTIKFTKKTID